MESQVYIIGGGLAGSECALQLAKRGVFVTLFEQRPVASSPAHKTAAYAELVCSNSFKSQKEHTAAGTLKNELQALDCELLKYAKRYAVPAGGALAVDRTLFAEAVTRAIEENPFISVVREEVKDFSRFELDKKFLIVATGPLTSPALLAHLSAILEGDTSCKRESLGKKLFSLPISEEHKGFLHFYDAAAPIVEAATLDLEQIFVQSRYDHEAAGDYLNCPLTKEQYETFVRELCGASTTIKKDFEKRELFQACQPIEEIAKTGRDALRFGPLKPVGLTDPRTGKRPWAAVQLRAENTQRTAYNLVGFQTNLTWPEQKRTFSLIPGLQQASFLRYGVMHQNAFLDAPRILDKTFAFVHNSHIRFAGQITGTEGYTEAIASGLAAALATFCALHEKEAPLFPEESVLGALFAYATDPATKNYQPMHVNFGLLPPLEKPIKNKRERYAAFSLRAQKSMERWRLANADLFAAYQERELT